MSIDTVDKIVDACWYVFIAAIVIDAVGYTVDFIKWVW